MDSHLLVDMYSPDLLLHSPEHWATHLSDHDVATLTPACSSSWIQNDAWDYQFPSNTLPDPRFYAPVAPAASATDNAACRIYSSRSGSSLQRDSRFEISSHHSLDATSHQASFDQQALDVQNVQNSRPVFDVAFNGQSFDASSRLTFDAPSQPFDSGHLAFEPHSVLDSRTDDRSRINYHPQQHTPHPSPSCLCASCFFAFSQHSLTHAIGPVAQQPVAQQQLHPQLPPLVITTSPSQFHASRRRSHDEMIDPSRIYAQVSRSTPALSTSSTTSGSSASPSPTRSSFSPDAPFAYSQPSPKNVDNPPISLIDISGQSSPIDTPLPSPPPTAQQTRTTSKTSNSNNAFHPYARSTRPRTSTTRKQPRATKPRPSESSSEDVSQPAPVSAPKTIQATPSTNHTGRPTLACFFCRQRKIACPPPAPDAEDLSCEQCVSRNQSCVYPTHTRRGLPKDKPAKKFTDEDIRNMGRVAREKEEARRQRRQEEEEAASASVGASSSGSDIKSQMFVLEQKLAQGGPRKSKRRKTTRRVIKDDDEFDGDD